MSFITRNGTIALTAIVIANVLVSLMAQVWILRFLGISAVADALVTSQAVPTLLLAIFGSALGKQLIPFFKDYGQAPGIVMAVVLHVGGAGLFLALLLAVTEPLWFGLLFAGMASEAQAQALPLTMLALAGMVLSLMVLALSGYWQSQHSFLRVELGSLVSGGLMLVALGPAISRWGAVGAAALLLLRAFLQMLFLLAPLENYRVSALPLAARRALLDGLRPALSAAAIFKMGPLVDRALASHLGPGAISLLNFLQQVYGTLLGVADRIFSPRLIAKVADARSSVMGVRELLQWHQRVVWGLAALALLGGLVLIWILPFIVGFFAHHPLSLDMHVLAGFFAIFLVAGVVGLQSASLLYGSNLSRVVFRVALINFLISILVRLMGMQYAGFYGLVAGIVLYQFLNAVVLSRDAGRHIGESVK